MRVLIVEDELTLANRLERLSKEILGEQLVHIKVIDNLDDADDYVNEFAIDLLLLDLNLKNRDGFQLLQQSVAGAFHTIVVSANVHRAIEAFEYGVLDFVGKPFTKQRLTAAFDRFNTSDRQADSDRVTTQFLSIKHAGQVEVVPVADIAYIKGASNYSELVLKNGFTKLHSKSLTKLIALLPLSFDRVHKSYIVDMSLAVKMESLPGAVYQLVLSTGDNIPVSRSKAKTLRQQF